MIEFLTTETKVVSMTDRQEVKILLRDILEKNIEDFADYRRKQNPSESEDLEHLKLFLTCPYKEKRINEAVRSTLHSLFKQWWHDRTLWGDWS